MSSEPPALFDSFPNDQIKIVSSFEELVTTRFTGAVNALCWRRTLAGDFREIASAITAADPIVSLDEETLRKLILSAAGWTAVEEMLGDLQALRARGLLPELNCIQAYPKEEQPGIVPLDVYSFHVDSATAEADTYLCTYFGLASEAVRNDEAFRYIDQPEIRAALLKGIGSSDDNALREELHGAGYDLHYGALERARPFSFGIGNLWRIATEYPGSPVSPCIHRAPATRPGDLPRLLLIS